MWYRCPRTDPFSSKNEQSNLSPATYTPYPSKKKKASRVPFNCSAPAHALADNGVPAPCTYTIRYRKHRIKGGVSLKFTEPRNTFCPQKGPSPLSYDPDLLYQREPKIKLIKKVCRKTTTCFVQQTANGKRAIPQPLKFGSNGRNEESRLLKFPYEVCQATLKYKGNHWSKYKVKRKFLYSGLPGSPGVGTYNLLDRCPNAWENYLVNLKEYKLRMADSLRSTDSYYKQLLREKKPAPNTYDVNFNSIYGHCSFSKKGTLPRAKRFVESKIIRPEQILNLSLPPSSTSTQRWWPPFNTSTTARPAIETAGTISPSKYDITNDSISGKLLKNLLKRRVLVPFNSSSVRKPVFSFNCNPGPGAYNISEPTCGVQIAGIMATRVPAVKLIPLRDRLGQGREVTPWTYEASKALDLLHKKRDFRRDPRWIFKKDFDRTDWAIKKDSPDVFYDPKDVDAVHIGMPEFSGRPKPDKVEQTPGPTDYNVNPIYTEAFYRTRFTHNVTYDICKKENTPISSLEGSSNITIAGSLEF